MMSPDIIYITVPLIIRAGRQCRLRKDKLRLGPRKPLTVLQYFRSLSYASFFNTNVYYTPISNYLCIPYYF